MLVTRSDSEPLKSQYTAYSWQRKRKNRLGDRRSTTPSFATPLTGVHPSGTLARVNFTMSMGMQSSPQGRLSTLVLCRGGGIGRPGLLFCSSSSAGFTTSIGRSNTLEPIGLSKNDDGVRSDANSRTSSGSFVPIIQTAHSTHSSPRCDAATGSC